MRRFLKVLFAFLLALSVAASLCASFVLLAFSDAFREFRPKTVSAYQNGEYTLIVKQMGHPDFPYGPAHVRLILKDGNGRRVAVENTLLYDDGGNMNPSHMKNVCWQEDRVTVTLGASEMEDTDISLFFAK